MQMQMAAILIFDGYFGSYINNYKSETFQMPDKTFEGIFINLMQENVIST